jgi:hypothetical protein
MIASGKSLGLSLTRSAPRLPPNWLCFCAHEQREASSSEVGEVSVVYRLVVSVEDQNLQNLREAPLHL